MKIRYLSCGLVLSVISACSIVDNYDEALMEDAEIESSSSVEVSSSSKNNDSSSSEDPASSASVEVISSSSVKPVSSSNVDAASSASVEVISSSSVVEESSSGAEVVSSSSTEPVSSSGDVTLSSSSAESVSSSSVVVISSSSAEAASSSSAEALSSSVAEPVSSSSVVVISSSSVDVFECGVSTVKRGNVEYNTVLLKDLCFTAENLKYETSVGNTMCYGDDESNCATYGRLYDYEAANVACPTGWRLPTSSELIELQEFSGSDVYDAGAHFKATSGWANEPGDNLMGFSGLPGGMCDVDGDCSNVGSRGYWWTSTESIKNQSHYTLFLNDDGGSFSAENKMLNDNFASVRCVKK